jgi:hypothetical protein
VRIDTFVEQALGEASARRHCQQLRPMCVAVAVRKRLAHLGCSELQHTRLHEVVRRRQRVAVVAGAERIAAVLLALGVRRARAT